VSNGTPQPERYEVSDERLKDRGTQTSPPDRNERPSSLFPTLDETRGATLVEGKHLWIEHRGLLSCRWCGLCRPYSGMTSKPCRGIVKVGLRA
jgi:hypothetical protein